MIDVDEDDAVPLSERGVPVGFCEECAAQMADDGTEALAYDMNARGRLIGLFCPHNSVAAVGVIVDGIEVGDWHTLSPASPERLAQMLEDIATAAEARFAALTATHH